MTTASPNPESILGFQLFPGILTDFVDLLPDTLAYGMIRTGDRGKHGQILRARGSPKALEFCSSFSGQSEQGEKATLDI